MNGKLRPREPHLPSLLFRVHLLISEPTLAFQLRVLWDKLLPLVEVSPCATFFSYSDSQTAARNWVCMMVVGWGRIGRSCGAYSHSSNTFEEGTLLCCLLL